MERGTLETAATGGCQCGAVRFSAKAFLANAHVCHCRMCQKASGNFFMALVGVLRDDLTWTRGEPAKFASSTHVRRGFCGSCGTPLSFERDGNSHVSIAIGAFDDPSKIPLAFKLGMEGRQPQIEQLAHLRDYGSTEDDDAEGAAAIKASNRQHPDWYTASWP